MLSFSEIDINGFTRVGRLKLSLSLVGTAENKLDFTSDDPDLVLQKQTKTKVKDT